MAPKCQRNALSAMGSLLALSMAQRARYLSRIAVHFAALVEVILGPGARGLVGDVIELVPQAVELLLALFVQDQFHQRGVVAVIAAGIVIARAQQAALIGRIVGPVAAALADIKGIGEDAGQTVESLLVFRGELADDTTDGDGGPRPIDPVTG